MSSHEIAMDDTCRVHILEPALHGKIRTVCSIDVRQGRHTRIWYKKY